MSLALQAYTALLRPRKPSPLYNTCQRHLRLSTSSSFRQDTTTPAQPPPPPISAFPSTSSSGSSEPSEPSAEPYFIRRSKSHNLPVYERAARGGNLRLTSIKKVEGDIGRLRDQLLRELNLDPKDVKVNLLTKQIVFKGWKKDEIVKFLEARLCS
ncbi:MAG: hypothetical protein M1816_007060 [Peltula sp. TS41687]|nr:MAG: hypothetical protein M1816_007060 [Peltula sp. TS41687]